MRVRVRRKVYRRARLLGCVEWPWAVSEKTANQLLAVAHPSHLLSLSLPVACHTGGILLNWKPGGGGGGWGARRRTIALSLSPHAIVDTIVFGTERYISPGASRRRSSRPDSRDAVSHPTERNNKSSNTILSASALNVSFLFHHGTTSLCCYTRKAPNVYRGSLIRPPRI